jgi:hypothetical protein
MKAYKVVVGALGVCIYGGAMAGTMGEASNWRRVITLSAGPAWADSGDTQTFFLAPEIEKTYSAAKNTSTLFDGEVFLGVQHSLNAIIRDKSVWQWLRQLTLPLMARFGMTRILNLIILFTLTKLITRMWQ